MRQRWGGCAAAWRYCTFTAAALGGGACTGLRTLSLGRNEIGEGGAAAVAAALGGGACGSLTTLDLGDNEIGEGGAAAVTAALGGGACGGLMELYLGENQIGPDAQQAVDDALADLPQAVQRRAAHQTVVALQRLALARVAVGAGSARWCTGGPVAAAIAALPFVASRTAGAPDHSLLLEVVHPFAGLPEVAPVVVVRHATQPAEHLAQDLVRDHATAAAAAGAATGIAGCADGRKRRRL